MWKQAFYLEIWFADILFNNIFNLKIMIPGGVLGLKTDGGVPLAAENWTQKDEKKYPKKIVLNPAKVKKGGQNRGTYVSPIT